MKSIGLIFIFSLIGSGLIAQQPTYYTGPYDSLAGNILLKNRYVEIEATQAMYDLYNMHFDRANSHLNYLKKQYGWHPLPYFLYGLSYWWRLLPYGAQETRWDDTFLAYMDTALVLSERLYDEVSEIEGAFFLAAVYSFQGRLYSERGDYIKASFTGKNSLKYLEECREHLDFSPEILFGDALFNYYAEWIRETYPGLKPLMMFFPHGDKKLGIKQLEETARNAFYARTEAQYFLMRILLFEENDVKGSMQIAEYLHNLYPDNAYFHRFYVRLLYQTGRYDEAIAECKEIINRIDLSMDGYEYNSGRYAAFFLGHIFEIRHELEESKKYFKYAIDYGVLTDSQKKGYHINALVHLGRIAVKEQQWQQAKDYYQEVRDHTKRKNWANKEAKKRLKEIKQNI
jgi:tetratricopeptide (TPR) repeat protein